MTWAFDFFFARVTKPVFGGNFLRLVGFLGEKGPAAKGPGHVPRRPSYKETILRTVPDFEPKDACTKYTSPAFILRNKVE